MCFTPDGGLAFHEVPKEVVEELKRRTSATMEWRRRAMTAESAISFLQRLTSGGQKIVSSAQLSHEDVQAAWKEERIFVDPDCFEYVLLQEPKDPQP